ncbi:MAG: DUF1553 domain-containing protein [Planctomycetota bacterium]
MKRTLLPALLLFLAAMAPVGAETVTGTTGDDFTPPFETGTGFVPKNAIDACVLAGLARAGIEPANPCSDAVFLRRVYVDLLGTLPDPSEVRRFQDDDSPDRRARLIDRLLERDEFVDYWTLKWSDLLRVKAEFPINLWPNGVQAYYRWIHDAVRDNMPYDAFARTLLTSSGSNFRAAPVNFYRAVPSETPSSIAAAAALTFMGTRLETWPEKERKNLEAFFSRVAFKKTAEWKEEIIYLDPAPTGTIRTAFPGGTPVEIAPEEDPRRVFTDWLLEPGNPWFARSIANRVWSWFLGRGIVHEPDDIRPDNPPSNPALLLSLETELVRSGYDLRQLFRFILNSRTYQGSSIPRSSDPRGEALFASYLVRRLDAEVLSDALGRLDGSGVTYASAVPEPFTILPNLKRSIRLKDGTITSPFLLLFGRPSRDTGRESERDNEPTEGQRLYLLNSREVQRRIERSPWLRRLVGSARRDPRRLINALYVAVLARDPTPREMMQAASYLGGKGRNIREAASDLTWALLNSKEFLYRH